jgi:hypothetical protein
MKLKDSGGETDFFSHNTDFEWTKGTRREEDAERK